MHILENSELKNYISLRAGGPAGKLIQIEPGDRLDEIIAGQQGGPVWVLGFGTNCLISDKGLPGTVLLNRTGAIEKTGPATFKVDSGADWDDFIQKAIAENLWGLEFTSGIPGGAGAAIVGNIAAYGHKVADCFVEATILNPADGSRSVWSKEQLGFDYRTSNLQLPENEKLVVLDATFELSPESKNELEYESALKVARELGVEPDSLQNRRQIIMETRRRSDSLLTDSAAGPWTAGSFFKNPVINEDQIAAIVAHEEVVGKTTEQILRQNQIHGQNQARVSAAHILLAAGFKRGQTWGQVRLDLEHVLKVENMGAATAQEIYDVVQEIINTVKGKLDIILVPEVRIMGDF